MNHKDAKTGKVLKRAKNPNLTGGSRKGKPNVVTAELKEMILEALGDAGGVKYLTDRANDPKTAGAFLSLVDKVLPMTIAGTGDNGALIVEITRFGSGQAT